MGFFDKLKAVFTRKTAAASEGREQLLRATKADSPRRASATRSKRAAGASKLTERQRRSKAWTESRQKKQEANLEKMARNLLRESEKAQRYLNRVPQINAKIKREEEKAAAKDREAAKKEAARIRAGEERAAATRKAREEKEAAALKKVAKNKWLENFRNNIYRLEGLNRPSSQDPYVSQGSMRKNEKLRNTTNKKGTQKGNKNRSLKHRANNWEPFAPVPNNNAAQRVAWGLRPRGAKKSTINWNLNLTNAFERPASPKPKPINKRAEIERNLADLFPPSNNKKKGKKIGNKRGAYNPFNDYVLPATRNSKNPFNMFSSEPVPLRPEDQANI